jgi:hypothetical protein
MTPNHQTLPDNDYSKFYGNSGLATKLWGPHAWVFLFASVIGSYPVTFDSTNANHIQIRRSFKEMFTSLQYTMPCVFCRNSYAEFIKEVPLGKFLSGRIQLMFWLYLIRDRVNGKLIKQEREGYNKEKKALKMKYRNNEISKDQYYSLVSVCKQTTIFTKPSPPFIEVLQKYEDMRAVCSPIAKTCSIAPQL